MCRRTERGPRDPELLYDDPIDAGGSFKDVSKAVDGTVRQMLLPTTLPLGTGQVEVQADSLRLAKHGNPVSQRATDEHRLNLLNTTSEGIVAVVVHAHAAAKRAEHLKRDIPEIAVISIAFVTNMFHSSVPAAHAPDVLGRKQAAYVTQKFLLADQPATSVTFPPAIRPLNSRG